MNYDSFIKRYVYLSDIEEYRDLKKRVSVDESGMVAKIRYYLKDDFTLLKANSILESIRMVPRTSDEFNASKGLTARQQIEKAKHDCYAALKIPLKRYTDGVTSILYEVTENATISYVGTTKDETFIQYVNTRKAVLAQFVGTFEETDAGLIVGSKLNFPGFVKEMYNRFVFDPETMLDKEPALVAWDKGPAFRVLNSAQLIENGPTPTWDEFLLRLEPAETFKAYVWSVFEPKNFGRQAMWLQGEGGDGKSTVLRAIANFMGTQHTLTIGIGSYDKDFFFGECFGKRLAIYPDCKNLQVLRKERIKQLLGRDIVPINNKYEKVFSAQVYSKLFVASNWMPQINYQDDSERTRLLLCKVKTFGDEMGDPDFQFKLESEMWAFLSKCRESYKRECPNGMSLRVPAEMKSLIKTQCSALDSDLLEEFINMRLEFGPGKKVSKTVLHLELKTFFSAHYATQMGGFSFNDLLRLLSKRGVPMEENQTGNLFIGVGLKNSNGTKTGIIGA